MRQFLIALLIISCGLQTIGQNTGIGVGTATPHSSAAFEVKDTARGLLPPRMTYKQRSAISNPAAGLMVWCSDCLPKGELQIYNGTEWTNITGGTAAVYYVQLPSVTIGTQTWQLKNLDVSTYRNGDSIPRVTDLTQWSNLTTAAWCWYNNDSATYAATYGKLYNWYAVSDARGLCPTGWHVSTDGEWVILENQLGGASVAGGALKNITGWQSPNTGATNSSGFSALPSGWRYDNGYFTNVGYSAPFWSSTVASATHAWMRQLSYISTTTNRGNNTKRFGYPVRCVRD